MQIVSEKLKEMQKVLQPSPLPRVLCKCIDKPRCQQAFHNLEWQKHLNNSDKTCQLRNAIKYDVLFVIAYFNISDNFIQWIILHSLVY